MGYTVTVAASGITYARQYASSGNYRYAGIAPLGSALSDPVWTIHRLTYASGAFVISQVATNVSWNNRASSTYT